jgi:RND superfamily putative drug exporter
MSVTAPPRPAHARRIVGLARGAALLTAPAGPRSKYLIAAAVVAVVALAGPLAGSIEDVEDNESTSRLPRGAQSTQVEQELADFNADGILGVTAVYTREGGLSEADMQAIEADRLALAGIAYEDKLTAPRLADDGEAAVLTFGMEAEASFDRFDEVREIVGTDRPDGLLSQVTGPMAALYDSVEVFGNIDVTILGASLIVVTLLLLLTYRSPVMWLLPILSIGVAMTVSQAIIYLLAQHAGLPVNGMSGGLLPILVFGVGTDYALLLVARYREELHRYEDRHVAVAVAMRRAGPAIIASAATVSLGLACLLLADLNNIRSLGAVGAIGVAVAAVAMLTVLPLLLTLLGRWVFWPLTPRAEPPPPIEPREPRAPDAACAADPVNGGGRGWQAVASRVTRSPRPVWLVTAVILAGLGLASVGLNIGVPAAEQFRAPPESVVGQDMLEQHFPAGTSAPVLVIANSSAADEVREVVASTDGVTQASAPGPSAAGERVIITATLANTPDSEAAEATVAEMRGRLASVDGAGAIVGGQTAQTLDVEESSVTDALTVIPAVLAVVLLVLFALLRAIVGPVLLLASVVLSYFAALGLGALAMRSMGFDALDVTLPLLSFVILVALGVDYTIFLMSRVREEALRRGTTDGVRVGLVATGGVITSAGLVLASTFGVLTVLPVVFMIGMGAVVALGILLDTFVVRSLLVPALTADLGHRFWWPGGLARGRRDLERSVRTAVAVEDDA